MIQWNNKDTSIDVRKTIIEIHISIISNNEYLK